MWLLAQTNVAERILTLGLMVLGLGAAAVIGFLIARRVKGWSKADPSTSGYFTLQDLRDMRNRGEIDQTEYERMRALIIGPLAAEKAAEAERRNRPGADTSDDDHPDPPPPPPPPPPQQS